MARTCTTAVAADDRDPEVVPPEEHGVPEAEEILEGDAGDGGSEGSDDGSEDEDIYYVDEDGEPLVEVTVPKKRSRDRPCKSSHIIFSKSKIIPADLREMK